MTDSTPTARPPGDAGESTARDPQGDAEVPRGSTASDAEQTPAEFGQNETAVPRGVWWALAAVTLLAAVARFYRLDHGGLWYDELIMARITAGSWSALWHEVTLGRPPIYPVLGMLWAELFGTSDAALRSLSATLSVLTVPVMFVVGRRLFDGRVGLVASLLLAVAPYQVYYGQEHRYYALFLLLCLASMALLLRTLGIGDRHAGARLDAGRDTRPLAWAGYVACSALAFYTHSFGLFLLVSIGVAVLVMYGRGRIAAPRMRRFLVSQVVIFGLIVPWAVVKSGLLQPATVDAAEQVAVPWISLPPWWAPVRTVGNFMFLGAKYLSLSWVIGGALVFAAGLVWAVRRAQGPGRWLAEARGVVASAWRERHGAWWLIWLWAAGPLVLVFVLSYTVKPIYNDRYMIASTAGFYLIVAAGIVTLARVLPAWATLGVVLLGMVGSLSTYYQQPEKGAWVEAAAWLDENLVEGEALAFSSERDIGPENANVRANWFWYAERGAEQDHLEIQVRADFNEMVRDLKAVSEPYAGVWLVMWRDPDEPLGLERSFAQGPVDGLALAEVKKFFDLTLMRFERTDGPVELADSEAPKVEAVDPSATTEEVGAQTP